MAGWGAEKIFHLTSSGEALGSLGPETLPIKANTVKLQRYGGALPMCLVPSVVSLVDLFKGSYARSTISAAYAASTGSPAATAIRH
jgi:hypothetical protein